MPTTSEEIETADRITALLAQPTVAAQAERLRQAGQLNEAGLSHLLDEAARLARSNPEKARQVTAVCTQLAPQAHTTHLAPRAAYIRAQTHAIKGELETALHLIDEAYDGYIAQDDTLPALRTNVGRIHVLNELGRHQEALATANSVLSQLAQEDDWPAQARLIVAHTYQNQGVCFRLMGRYEDALQAYQAAESHYQAMGMEEHLGDIQNNRGLILLHLGRARAALAAFTTAESILANAGRTLLQAQALYNIGDAHLLLGHYRRSLAALDEAHDLLADLGKLSQNHTLLLQRGHVYLALNLYPEALAAYEEAETACRRSGMRHYLARSLWGKGVALMAEARHEGAAEALAEAAELFAAADNTPMLCSVRLEQAALQALQGQPAPALATAEAALALVAEGHWPVQQLYAHLRVADLLPAAGAAAKQHLYAARALLETLALPHWRYRVYQRLGAWHWQHQQLDEAQQWLETAVFEIERLRGTVAQEVMRVSFLRDKTAAYDTLLRVHLARSQQNETAVNDAFLTAERAKSRTLLDLINGVIEVRDFIPDDPDVAQTLQQLQTDLNAVYSAFLGTTDAVQADTQTLQQRAHELEQAIHRLRLHAGSHGRPNPFASALPVDEILANLPPDRTLVAYHIVDGEVIAFVKVGQTLQWARELTTETAVQEQLQQLSVQWQRLRTGSTFVQRHMPRLIQSTNRVLGDLYQQLVAPLASLLPAGDVAAPEKLVVVPHGILHQVPFQALWDGRRYLLEPYEIVYAPSATVYVRCWERPLRPLRRAVVVGVDDPLIPAATAEAEQVAAQFSQASLCVQDEATGVQLRSLLPQADVVHLATHGIFRADNPIFSGLKLHDGWLQAADVLTLSLQGARVVLSACESGRSQVDAGDEVLGLPRAFLGAGALSLVVSLWVVVDTTTADLMVDWYRRLLQTPTPDQATTLRAAQLALKEKHPHPYYWAPFVLMGRT